MNSAEAGIDEEVNKSEKTKDLEELREKLKKSIQEAADPEEKQRLMDQIAELETNLQKQIAADLANQNSNLDAKRKKRSELLQLKKMQIEAD